MKMNRREFVKYRVAGLPAVAVGRQLLGLQLNEAKKGVKNYDK